MMLSLCRDGWRLNKTTSLSMRWRSTISPYCAQNIAKFIALSTLYRFLSKTTLTRNSFACFFLSPYFKNLKDILLDKGTEGGGGGGCKKGGGAALLKRGRGWMQKGEGLGKDYSSTKLEKDLTSWCFDPSAVWSLPQGVCQVHSLPASSGTLRWKAWPFQDR